jgi:hypothetical protein
VPCKRPVRVMQMGIGHVHGSAGSDGVGQCTGRRVERILPGEGVG